MKRFNLCAVVVFSIAVLITSCTDTNPSVEPIETGNIQNGINPQDNYSKEEDVIIDDNVISLQFYESFHVDTSGIRKHYNLSEDLPFTYLDQSHNMERLQEFADAHDVVFPDFGITDIDFQGRYLIVTFGRELIDLRKIGDWWHGETFAAFTFAEEYHEQTMFLYFSNELVYPPYMGEHEFYVMKGSERVYHGHTIDFVMTK